MQIYIFNYNFPNIQVIIFLKFIYILKPYMQYKIHFGGILKENLTYMSMYI